MELAGWARRNGVRPQTAQRWFREGTVAVPARRLPCGTVMVDVAVAAREEGTVVVYARVSPPGQCADLDRQVARVSSWVAVQGMVVSRVVTGVGSVLNGRGRKFLGAAA